MLEGEYPCEEEQLYIDSDYKDLKNFEIELFDKGIPEKTRSNIRNSKICIIDDKNEDLVHT